MFAFLDTEKKMAQKKRPGLKRPAKAKVGAAKVPSKKKAAASAAKSKPASKKIRPVAPTKPKLLNDVAANPRAKSAAPKAKPPAPKAVASKPTAPKSSAPQLARAKSALKVQNDRSTPTSVEPAAPAVKPKATKPLSARAEKARARKLSIQINANEAASALAAKWSTLFKRAENIEAQPYSMRTVYEERTAIVHQVLGWGYILANRNDRLEVLFKDGIKYLISNYKP